MIVTLFGAANAHALSVNPGTYDPDNTGAIVSKLVTSNGDNYQYVAQKNAVTSTNAAAFASVTGWGGISELGGIYQQYAPTLTSLGFEVSGYCGAGSPRFNVTTTNGITHFFGCIYGMHTALANGWQKVSFARSDAFPPVSATDKIASIDIVADEQGQSKLRQINVNGQVGLPK